jgi:LysR family transcriptional regulator, nitrogen assimilation regulatory protein
VDLRQMRYFEAVARYGSFTHASSKLAIAQPALGVQVRKLEEELGAQLFTRSARGVELTDAGRVLLDFSRRILADVERTKKTIRNGVGPPRGPLRLGLTPSVSAALAIPLIKRSRALLPDVQLSIVENVSSDLIDLLLAERLDMALAFDVRPTKGLYARMLLQDEAVLIEPRTPATSRAPVEFADALTRRLILPSRPHRMRVLIEQHAKKLRIGLNVVFEVQWPATTLALVEHGLGVTIVSRIIAQSMSTRRLAARPIIRPKLRYPFFLVRLESISPTKGESAMEQILETMVKETFGAVR